MIAILDSTAANFDRKLTRLLVRGGEQDQAVEAAAANIIAAVRRNGDAALVKLTARLDRHKVANASAFELPPARLAAALKSLESTTPKVAAALRTAARRIKRYHRFQVQRSWQFEEPDGTRLGQRITPIERVGVYVPGGKAAYPSSVLMTVIPATVAGVGEIIMTVPAPGGEVNRVVLAAAALAGVDRVFTIGGAQAIAALAYGTETVPAVDKIVGPGNSYVAAAKRLVFGQVGIDTIAGPSEVVIICDRTVNSDWVAMDLFAQAEHDERAQSIAITDSEQMIAAIRHSITNLLPQMQRREIIAQSLAKHGALIKVDDLGQAVALSNRIAPEHLELMVAKPRRLLGKIRHAGAIFIGDHSAESLGDYCAGPNHVLPTAGTARFSSPLGVYDFQKRSSVIQVSARAVGKLAAVASTLARCEGLDAHARSAEYRLPAITRRKRNPQTGTR